MVQSRDHRILDGDISIAIGIRNRIDTLCVSIQLTGNIVQIVEDIARILAVRRHGFHLSQPIFPCLQVFQRANQCMIIVAVVVVGDGALSGRFGANVAQHKVPAVDPIAGCHTAAVIALIQRALLHTVHIQINHVAAVSIDTVHQSVGMRCSHIDRHGMAVMLKVVAAVVRTDAHHNAVICHQNMGRIQRIGGRGRCHQHERGIAALAAADSALPLDSPGLIME